MNVISTTEFRSNISKYVGALAYGAVPAYVIGRRDNPEAVVIPFPKQYNKSVSDITNVNANSGTFDFLDDEPELYSSTDIIH